MSTMMDEEIRRRTTRRESALILEIVQGRTTLAQKARKFELTPAEIDEWTDRGNQDFDAIY
jgi:hypothetical protein